MSTRFSPRLTRASARKQREKLVEREDEELLQQPSAKKKRVSRKSAVQEVNKLVLEEDEKVEEKDGEIDEEIEVENDVENDGEVDEENEDEDDDGEESEPMEEVKEEEMEKKKEDGENDEEDDSSEDEVVEKETSDDEMRKVADAYERSEVKDEEEGNEEDSEAEGAASKHSEDEEVDESGAFFAQTLSSLVGNEKEQRNSTVLTKRKTKEIKEIEKEAKEKKQRKLSQLERRDKERQGLAGSSATDIVLERQLRKIATRGVIALFNAIESHQYKAKVAAKEKEQKAVLNVKNLSKESFLDMLKKGGEKKGVKESSKPKASAKSSGWDALRDDYMLDAKLKDFDGKEMETEHEDERGFDLEEVEDDE